VFTDSNGPAAANLRGHFSFKIKTRQNEALTYRSSSWIDVDIRELYGHG
jgi:hypothetical protein